jgi:protocatechuate 3,4-dioxygenase beta subunit
MWMHLLLLSSLSGSVLDEAKNPVEGAVIVATAGTGFRDEPSIATSDAKGRFEVELGRTGLLQVEAYAPGFIPFRGREIDPKTPLVIVLRRGGETLTGAVRDGTSREPLEGAVLETRSSDRSSRVSAEPRLGLVEVVSDERGEFRIEGLEKRPYSVSASAPGYGRTVKENVVPGHPFELYLFPGSGVYGRLLDEKGKPVRAGLVSAESENPIAVWPTAQTSDEDGYFSFLGLEPGRYRLVARHEDFAPAVKDVELSKDGDSEVEIVLSAGVTLTGQLVGEANEPVAGKVSLRGIDGGPVSVLLRSRLSVETDSEGSFSLGPLPAGEHTLQAESRGYASKNVDVSVSGRASVEDVGDVALERGLSISGRVIDETGKPIARAVVMVNQPARGMLSSTGEGFLVSETDEEGRFVLAGLSPGPQHVHASAPGYGRSDFIAAEPGMSGLTLTLELAGEIRGIVVDPDGRPVPAFRAVARSSAPRGTPTRSFEDAEGLFVLESVPEGEYALEIAAPELMPEVVSSVRVTRGGTTDVGTVRLRRGGSIEGTVVDSSAEPVPGATIQAMIPAQRRYWMPETFASSDRLGRFQVEGLADGKFTVVARHPDYAEARLEDVEVDSSASAPEVEIVLSRGGALEGVVRTRDGTDVAGRVIEVYPQQNGAPWWRSGQNVRTSEDGTFRFEHLPSGRVTAGLQQTDGDTTFTVSTREVEIVEGETAYVEFLSRSVLVQGHVRRGGSPLGGVEIELWPDGPGFSTMHGGRPVGPPSAGPRYLVGVSGEDGYFELLVGEPGGYSVSASAYGVGLPSRTVSIPDVEAYPLDLDFGGALVSGRVVDDETESPVSGAFVYARATERAAGESGAGLQTGPDGAFELELQPGEFTIVARAEGYAAAEKKVEVPEGGRSDVVLSLSTGLPIAGRVIDASGRGVANVRVLSVEDVPDLSTPPVRMGFATTIPDGTFRLNDLARGRYNILAVSAGGFAFLPSVARGTEDLEISLQPGGKVEVLVVDSARAPVANAIVGVVALEGRKARGIQASTDGTGRLELAVPRGNVTIKATRGNGPEAMRTVSVSGKVTARVEIALGQAESSLSRR